MARRRLMKVPLGCAIAMAFAGCHLAGRMDDSSSRVRPTATILPMIAGEEQRATHASFTMGGSDGATVLSDAHTQLAAAHVMQWDAMRASAASYVDPLVQQGRDLLASWLAEGTHRRVEPARATWSPAGQQSQRVAPPGSPIVRRPGRDVHSPGSDRLVRHEQRRGERFFFGMVVTVLSVGAMRRMWRRPPREVTYCPHCGCQRIAKYCANCGRAVNS